VAEIESGPAADQQPVADGIFHAVLVVRSMAEALRFFVSTLGFRVTFDAPHDPESLAEIFGIVPAPRVHAIIVEGPDGSELEIAEYLGQARPDRASPEDPSEPGLRQLSLRVRDLDATVSHVSAHGYRFTGPIVTQPLPDGSAVRLAVCIGPEGIFVAFVELRGRRLLDHAAPAADLR
jgi:catechol 2,3-dioxygenase-like lactoylglutathione lyase family enzyme